MADINFLTELKAEYSYMSDDDINRIIRRAKFYYYSKKYQCYPDANEETNPITSFQDQNWVLEACRELIERLGIENAVTYKENGISMTFDNAKLSNTLLNSLTPLSRALK